MQVAKFVVLLVHLILDAEENILVLVLGLKLEVLGALRQG
jgi:hypothetical protein